MASASSVEAASPAPGLGFVVPDAFERLHRRWPSLERQDSSLAYVRSSVLNSCRSVHRRALVARRHAPGLADLNVDEIAATSQIGPSAVRSTAARGIAALARALQEADR